MKPHEVTAVFGRHRTAAIVRANDTRLAADAIAAAIDGGIRIVEFTLTTPGAFELIAELVRAPTESHVDVAVPVTDAPMFVGPAPTDREPLVVGAGTVLEVAQVEQAARAGASFVVSPIFDPEIVRAAESCGLAAIPGTQTPTEMMMAYRAGASMVKLFPQPGGQPRGDAGAGPAWLQSVLAPLPMLRVVPTNGVTRENLGEWLDAGAWAVGLVADLFRPAWLAAGDFAAITAHAEAIRQIADAAGPHPAAGD
jgi:2-dehydro-3-deoxyphosphogluconate aldolase/(4S)-4-hydroxy-2-oxoglutarate aldolase